MKGANFGRVGQAVHHVGNAAVFQAFGHGLPAILDQFGCILRIDAFFDHFIEAENGTGLEHAAKNSLLTH